VYADMRTCYGMALGRRGFGNGSTRGSGEKGFSFSPRLGQVKRLVWCYEPGNNPSIHAIFLSVPIVPGLSQED